MRVYYYVRKFIVAVYVLHYAYALNVYLFQNV
jgi:hypothetical protein